MARDDDRVAKRIADKRKTIENKSRNDEERAKRVAQTKAEYQQRREDPVLQDILTKAKTFIAYHNKIAQDGVGSIKTGDKYQNGSDVYEVRTLSHEERVGHLDKSSGIQELVDYINRQLEGEIKTPEAAAEEDEPVAGETRQADEAADEPAPAQ